MLENISNYEFDLFQFHKGAIRTPVISAISLEDIDFNSIKVRLEPVKSWA